MNTCTSFKIFGSSSFLLTVTSHVAFTPLTAVAVTTAVPGMPVVSTPSLTLTDDSLFDDQVTLLSVASSGPTAAVSVTVSSCTSVTDVSLSVTLVGAIWTSTAQAAVTPFAVSAVIVALPSATPVSLPPSTRTMLSSELVQLTSLSTAFSGSTLAVSVFS